MIRLVVYLLILATIAFGVAWLADRPGAVVIDWQGWHIETSILVAIGSLPYVIKSPTCIGIKRGFHLAEVGAIVTRCLNIKNNGEANPRVSR